MELRPGYKRTEVGVIPEDWAVRKLGDQTFKVGSGITPTGGQRVYREAGRPFVRSQNIGWGTLILDDVAYIDDATHGKFADTEIQENDVFLNITGASIGRSAVADARLVGGNVNQHVCIIRTTPAKLVPGYLNCFLLSAGGQRQIDSFQTGGNRQGLNFAQVRSIAIPVPPTLAEQRAIAAALSDADALLAGLDGLIAKQRALKQAAMQQLLTGKTRLPGFCDEWQEQKLGDVARISTGTKNNEDKVEDGDYPLFVRSQKVERINTYSYDGEAVLIPGEGGIGSIVHYVNGKYDCHQRVYNIREFKPDIHAKFIYYVLTNSFYMQALRNSVKATVDSLRLPTFLEFSFLAPGYEEQIVIAAVISDMDAEIAALERRRAKTHLLKQAMMQELLTGQTRLVPPGGPDA